MGAVEIALLSGSQRYEMSMMSIDVWPMWAGTIVVVISRRTAALTVFILTAVILAFVAWMIIWSGRHRR